MKTFREISKEKVIVFDGATGTNLQNLNLTPDDFGGDLFYGCNEYLVITRPNLIEKLHSEFLEVGCDVIETNTFGANGIVLQEYGLQDHVYEINYKAALIAKRVANEYFSISNPRFVAGSIGPTTKLPSLGHISFKDLEATYYKQARGLVDGGVDLLVVETCQDLLQTKAAISGIFNCLRDLMKKLPVVVSITIEPNSMMLLGTDISAALTTIRSYPIFAFGLNCATGPMEMSEHIRYLSSNSPFPIFCMPNAGIPQNINGKIEYNLLPKEFTDYLSYFVKDFGVSLVGGCCGTKPEHIKKLVESVGDLAPEQRKWNYTPSVSSLFQSVPLKVEIPPVIVGERMNANGSKIFRRLLLNEQWDMMMDFARKQINEGAHILDLSLACVGREEISDYKEVVKRYNTQITAPLMIDSTNTQAIEAALQHYAGKAIINSINLEEGEEKFEKIVNLALNYGAALIALTIDEDGMAKTAAKKLKIAERIYKLAVLKYKMLPCDLIFDPLTFTLSSGDEDFRKSAIETLDGIKLIKEKFPDVKTSLGISNISYGFNENARNILNSVFLYYAVQYGLDMAIVHPSKILPLYKISEVDVELCRKLIFDERSQSYDPLKEFLERFSKSQEIKEELGEKNELTIEEKLISNIVDGTKVNILKNLDEALKKYSPIEIINQILLEGMKKVGNLFGSGKMQLPFVLQSAEVMKTAVSYLEKYLTKTDIVKKGTMVLATVKGDVHDIGKNLVDIILSNNGYKIINLGIRVPIETIIKAVEEHKADAIGMSGLLVKSTYVMKENLEILNERRIKTPVILGGAALTRKYVEKDLRKIYNGYVEYANDAFDGLKFMEKIISNKISVDTNKTENIENKESVKIHFKETNLPETDIPNPPFWGSKVVENIPLDDVFSYINEIALIKGQWRIYKDDMTEQNYRDFLEKQIYPEIKRIKDFCKSENIIIPKVVYGYFPCQSDGNDLVIYRIPENLKDNNLNSISNINSIEWVRFTFPRQKSGKYLCIADFFASKGSGKLDVCAFQVVTIGRKASDYAQRLFKENKYKDYLYFYGFSVVVAEALAEYWHSIVRKELNIQMDDSPEIKKIFSKHYRGARYSFGYPACPNLNDQEKLFKLLNPEKIGVELTEEYHLIPEQSITALIVHHPEARYFNI